MLTIIIEKQLSMLYMALLDLKHRTGAKVDSGISSLCPHPHPDL